MLVAHSHDVFARKAETSLFINPGSVGRPFDQDPRGSYAILSFDASALSSEFCRVEYDISPCLRVMQKEGFSPALVRALAEARSPADLLPEGVSEDVMITADKLGADHELKKPHALQVAKLSLKLFDTLKDVHGLGPRERLLLQLGAYLHDIGLSEGASAHHKASRNIILAAKGFSLTPREQSVVALIARYHRKSLPASQHKHFVYLPDHHKMLVERLGALVRMADGLDRSHQSLVSDVKVESFDDEIFLRLIGKGDMSAEVEFGKLKSDLFEKAFGRRVRFLVREKTKAFCARQGG
jgi:exopolyphosphatase/guanosine-5'-triphosphate,3'-diphosphate pyrophosphatase